MSNPNSLSVYVIDDDHDDFYFLNEHFSERFPELHIKHFPEPREFLKKAEKIKPPCLVVLDVNMPALNGFSVLKELRAKKDWSKIPVVFLSTSTDPKNIHEAKSLGAVAYLVKPVPTNKWVEITERLTQICKDENIHLTA